MYFDIPKVEHKPSNPPRIYLHWVKNKIKKNKNFIAIFNGGTGSGKSWATLYCAYELAQEFNTPFSIKNNLAFSFKDLIKKMKELRRQPGNVFIMEEVGSVGSGGASSEWQAESNKFFHSFLQTSRYLNQIVLLNCPSFNYLMKGARELVHYQFDSIGVNHKINKSFFKGYWIQTNTRTGKQYFKYIRYKTPEGVKKKYNIISFPKPPEDLINDYEIAKDKFYRKLEEKFIYGKEEVGQSPKHQDTKPTILKLSALGVPTKEISELLGCTDRWVRMAKSEMEGRKSVPAPIT